MLHQACEQLHGSDHAEARLVPYVCEDLDLHPGVLQGGVERQGVLAGTQALRKHNHLDILDDNWTGFQTPRP